MGRRIRRLCRARFVAPAALLAAVGVFGLVAFSPNAARAANSPSLYAPGSNADIPSNYPTLGAYLSANAPGTTQGINVPGAPPVTPIPLPASFIAPGEALFAANCASCHGPTASGLDASGQATVGPPLQGLGAGTVDFWVGTGRMPLANAAVQATRKPPRFDRQQTLELAAFVQSLAPGGTQVPAVNLYNADLSEGNELYTLNCAACHTITGAGDELADGAYAPSLHLATVQQIVEAIRSGPGNMPHFGPGDITDAQARDIASYVHDVIQHPNNAGGTGLGGVGPVGEGFVGLLVGVGVLMLVCFWIGDRV